jgi:hypothetical protein
MKLIREISSHYAMLLELYEPELTSPDNIRVDLPIPDLNAISSVISENTTFEQSDGTT